MSVPALILAYPSTTYVDSSPSFLLIIQQCQFQPLIFYPLFDNAGSTVSPVLYMYFYRMCGITTKGRGQFLWRIHQKNVLYFLWKFFSTFLTHRRNPYIIQWFKVQHWKLLQYLRTTFIKYLTVYALSSRTVILQHPGTVSLYSTFDVFFDRCTRWTGSPCPGCGRATRTSSPWTARSSSLTRASWSSTVRSAQSGPSS
jgi:hypothetical protein